MHGMHIPAKGKTETILPQNEKQKQEEGVDGRVEGGGGGGGSSPICKLEQKRIIKHIAFFRGFCVVARSASSKLLGYKSEWKMLRQGRFRTIT